MNYFVINFASMNPNLDCCILMFYMSSGYLVLHHLHVLIIFDASVLCGIIQPNTVICLVHFQLEVSLVL